MMLGAEEHERKRIHESIDTPIVRKLTVDDARLVSESDPELEAVERHAQANREHNRVRVWLGVWRVWMTY